MAGELSIGQEVSLQRPPMSAGKVGTWLFIVSEMMLFVGLLGSYIVLQGEHRELFDHQARNLSRGMGGISTLILIVSSLTMTLSIRAARNNRRGLLVLGLVTTLLGGSAFLGIQGIEYIEKLNHHTVVARTGNDVYIYDGYPAPSELTLTINGNRRKLTGNETFDVHTIAPKDLAGTESGSFQIRSEDISEDLNYGPSKNIFWGCYFTLTSVHALHVIGGLIAIALLLVALFRGKALAAHTEYVGMYWYFVDIVWVILFGMLYWA